jgi:branched-chain amino acid transport system permease protein
VFSVTAYYYFAGVLMMLAFWLQRNIVFSDFGRKIQAIKYSDVGAASVGIRVHREKVIVFMLSAMFAGLGGALFAHLQNFINPDDFRFENSIFLLLTILFGGAGTLTGPLIGAAFLTLVPELLQDAEKFRLIIFAVLIVTTLYFLPNGVAGLFARGRKGAVVSSPSGGDPAQTPPASSRPNDGENALGGAPFMSVRSIGKAFGGVVALKDVSLDIQRGQIHALIGPNGAGKTTLVNILSGYYSPDAGGLRLGSKAARLTSLHHAARLGVVRTFQTLKLFSDLTVRENVMVGCELSSKTNLFDALLRTRRHRFELRRRQDLADAWLAFVGLTAYRDSPASVLAYGHRRWLELARALASGPQLLLLDEPAAGLVANEIEDLARIIRRIRETGVALLLIEHHMDLVGAVADYITVLDHGEVISSGTVATVLADPVVIEAYLGTPQDQDYVSAGG